MLCFAGKPSNQVMAPHNLFTPRDRGVVEGAGDAGPAVPGQPLDEHPLNDRRGYRVGLQAAGPPSPRGVRLVGMRTRVGEPVPVRRPAAEVAALLAGLGGHRGADPDPGDLPLGLQPLCQHHLLMILGLKVDPPSGFWVHSWDAVVLEQGRHLAVLAAIEGPLVFAHHDRVEPAVWIGHRRQHCGGLRAARRLLAAAA